jgi:hypothetical protein
MAMAVGVVAHIARERRVREIQSPSAEQSRATHAARYASATQTKKQNGQSARNAVTCHDGRIRMASFPILMNGADPAAPNYP